MPRRLEFLFRKSPSVSMGRLKRLGEVIKSPADKKEYRALKLKVSCDFIRTLSWTSMPKNSSTIYITLVVLTRAIFLKLGHLRPNDASHYPPAIVETS